MRVYSSVFGGFLVWLVGRWHADIQIEVEILEY